MKEIKQWIEMQTNVMQCFSSLFVSEDSSYGDGASRVRKGTPGSLPSGLLTPIVPWMKLHWTFTGCNGLNLKHMGENLWNLKTYEI